MKMSFVAIVSDPGLIRQRVVTSFQSAHLAFITTTV